MAVDAHHGLIVFHGSAWHRHLAARLSATFEPALATAAQQAALADPVSSGPQMSRPSPANAISFSA